MFVAVFPCGVRDQSSDLCLKISDLPAMATMRIAASQLFIFVARPCHLAHPSRCGAQIIRDFVQPVGEIGVQPIANARLSL